MGYNIRPNKGALLNPVHPLSRDIMACWIMNEGQGSLLNDNSRNANTGTLINGASWSVGKYGPSVSTDGTNDAVDCGTISRKRVNLSQGDFTIGVLAYNRGSGTSGTVVAKRDSTFCEVQFYLNSSTLLARVDAQTGDSGITFPNSDGWCWLFLAYDASATNEFTVYKYVLDTGILTSANIAINFPTITRRDVNLSFGARWGTYPTTAFPGPFDFGSVFIFRSLWDSSKIRNFVSNPYTAFEHSSHGWMAAPVAGGITGTLSETLAGVSSSASGIISILGTSNITLSSDTSSIAGIVGSSGSSNITLDNDSLTASGIVGTISGSANITLGNDTLSAYGTIPTEANKIWFNKMGGRIIGVNEITNSPYTVGEIE